MNLKQAFQISPEPWSESAKTFYSQFLQERESLVYAKHTDQVVIDFVADLKSRLLSLLGLSGTHQVAFIASSARELFAKISYQFAPERSAFIDTGYWSRVASEYSKHNADCSVVKLDHFDSKLYDFIHFCHLETISGFQYNDLLKLPKAEALLSCDMTGSFFSLDQDYSHCDIITAASGKQFGFPGMSVLILSHHAIARLQHYPGKDSLIYYFDRFPVTPPLMQILSLDWACKKIEKSGVDKFLAMREYAAAKFYRYIDVSKFWECSVPIARRSTHLAVFSAHAAYNNESAIELFKNHKANPGTLRVSFVWSYGHEKIETLCDYLEQCVERVV